MSSPDYAMARRFCTDRKVHDPHSWTEYVRTPAGSVPGAAWWCGGTPDTGAGVLARVRASQTALMAPVPKRPDRGNATAWDAYLEYLMYVHQQQVAALMVRIATLESTVYRHRHKAPISKEETTVTVNTDNDGGMQNTEQPQPFDGPGDGRATEHRTPMDPIDNPLHGDGEPQPFDETAVHYTGPGNDPLLYP